MSNIIEICELRNSDTLEFGLLQKTLDYFNNKLKETKGNYFWNDYHFLHIDAFIYDRCFRIVDDRIRELCFKLWDILLDAKNDGKTIRKNLNTLGKEVFEIGGLELQKEIADYFCPLSWRDNVLCLWRYEVIMSERELREQARTEPFLNTN